jgi:cytosine/adenosine deaminase-related metal-dependent hydrolase
MSEWSNNNLAHIHTWMCLRILTQIPTNTTFDVAGKVRMNALTFWSDLDSPAQRATKANSLAAQMDNFFRLIQGAQYEPGVDVGLALQSLATTLQDSAQAVKHLANKADACYRFRHEGAV